MRSFFRSMNADLSEGMTDGKVRKLSPNRGGDIEQATEATRESLDYEHYGARDAGFTTTSSLRPDAVEFIP